MAFECSLWFTGTASHTTVCWVILAGRASHCLEGGWVHPVPAGLYSVGKLLPQELRGFVAYCWSSTFTSGNGPLFRTGLRGMSDTGPGRLHVTMFDPAQVH